MQPLPIDPVLPEIVAALGRERRLVLEAPPGAGKTTRVPRALLEAGVAERGEIVVLEPRRLAARLAAARVADELGERLGERVGYTVRFDDVSSPRTKIRFVTEGTLTRWLLSRPRLEGVAAVLLDEVHERHLVGDVALALLRRLAAEERPDLVLAAMSATLDGDAIAGYLGAPVLRAEGRRFDVEIRHLERDDDRPLPSLVVSAVRDLVREGLDGHVLVFLPGAREIRKTMEALSGLAAAESLAVLPLHGDLPPDEQDVALRPSSRRKIILSTNVAESSVTIDGVAAVVDGGLARVLVHSPWTGLASLRTERISRASATQRAGRAGRTRAGKCLRLYSRRDFETRPEHDVAEILRADLAETVLELAAHGASARTFAWLEAPPAASLDAAESLLARLGALDGRAITPLGRELLRYPLHPRLARLVEAGRAAGVGREACTVAALLAERDVRRAARTTFAGASRGAAHAESARSDVLERLEDVETALRQRLSPAEMRARDLDAGAVLAADRVAKRLVRLLPRSRDPGEHPDVQTALLRAVLLAFPDRVARRRRPGGRDLVLSGGGSAVLSEASVVHGDAFLVVVSTQEGRTERGAQATVATLASGVDPEWLLELFPERIRESRETTFDSAAERVDSFERLLYDDLVLDETRGRGDADEEARVLAEAAEKRGLPAFSRDPDATFAWLSRARFVAEQDPTFPRFDGERLRDALRALCQGRRSFDELRSADLAAELSSLLSGAELARLAAWAPSHVELPSGRRARIHYDEGKPPYVASRLQDFFGTIETPRVAAGRVPLVVHLLAPSQRPVQITSDLAGFWKNTYPSVRKELCRKYPKHAWPDDPRTFVRDAPSSTPRGGRR